MARSEPLLTAGAPQSAPTCAEDLTDAAGRRIGWTHLDDAGGSIALDGYARFDFELDPVSVRWSAEPAISEVGLRDAWERCALPLALHAAGELVLHASAVLGEGGVTLIAGPSGVGKSTLRAAMARLGFPPFGDDAIAVGFAEDGPRGAFLPFTPKPAHGEPASGHVATPPGGVADPPILAVAVIRRSDGAPSVSRLSGSEAFRRLLENAYCLPPFDSDAARRTVDAALELAAAVPVFELAYAHTGRAEPATVGALTTIQRRGSVAARERAGVGANASSPPPTRLRRGIALVRRLRTDRPALLAAARIALRYWRLRALARRLGPARLARLALRSSRRASEPDAEAARRALAASAALFPAGAVHGCTERSFAIARALADAGYEPVVALGWSAALGHGHAWLELDGLPVADDTMPGIQFAELARFDARGESSARTAAKASPGSRTTR